MTPRSFLQNQLRNQERDKLAALPTNDVLTLLFGQKQPLNASLTTLSGKTIGTKGLDLLASSTSVAAVNALGGSGGQFGNSQISDLDASKLTGVIDVARLPVIPGNNSISATSISSLTSLQQAAVSLGTMVYTADGGAWRYSGSGSKTSEASYYYTADVTPEWTAVANKPAFGTAAFQEASAFATASQGASADAALAGLADKASLTALNQTLQGLQIGSSIASRNLNFDGPAGGASVIQFRELGKNFWQFFKSGDGNFGVNKVTYDGGGNPSSSQILYIDRTSGKFTFSVRPEVAGGGLVESQGNRGQANGYAPLGPDNLVPSNFLPAASGSYKGGWNASTNTPAITAGVRNTKCP